MAAGEYKEIEEREGPDRAALFDAVANREVTPLRTFYDEWASDSGFKPRTIEAHKQAFDMLERFLASERLPVIVEAVDERVAADFRTKALIRAGLASATGNKLLSSLRSYWAYLIENSHVASNPWRGKSIRKRRNEPEMVRRSFTDDEARTLLTDSRCPPRLLPLMMIAAFSAARREEIMQLTCADVADSKIRIRDSKTSAGVRVIPQHSKIRPVIARLVRRKQPRDFLIPSKSKGTGPRGDAIGKLFTRYRRAVLGNDESIVFHSWRYFATRKMVEALRAGAAGFDHWTIADCTGHEKGELPLAMTPSENSYKAT
jgi:integrase